MTNDSQPQFLQDIWRWPITEEITDLPTISPYLCLTARASSIKPDCRIMRIVMLALPPPPTFLCPDLMNWGWGTNIYHGTGTGKSADWRQLNWTALCVLHSDCNSISDIINSCFTALGQNFSKLPWKSLSLIEFLREEQYYVNFDYPEL